MTYAPISSSFESATIYFNVDGVFHKITGARGTFSLQMSVKQIPVLKFTLTGIYNAVTDSAAPTPTYTIFQTPLPVTNINTTPFTLHSYAAVMSELTMDLSANIVHRTLVGGSGAGAVHRPPAAGLDYRRGDHGRRNGLVDAREEQHHRRAVRHAPALFPATRSRWPRQTCSLRNRPTPTWTAFRCCKWASITSRQFSATTNSASPA